MATEPEPIGVRGRWLAEDVGGGVVDRIQTVLEFREDGSVGGSGGCNRFTGGANVGDGTIRFKPIAATRMMCPPATMDQEAKFFAALGKTARWAIDQRTRKLTLFDTDGQTLAVLARMD